MTRDVFSRNQRTTMSTEPIPPAEPPNLAAPRKPGFLNRHRSLSMALALLAVIGAASYLTWFFWPEPDHSPPAFAWYTVDDGKSWFQDDFERIPPFQHEGKPAVRLHLYSCDGGKTTFVGYLQKLPEEAFQKYRDKGIDPAKVDDDELAAESGWLAKRPGQPEWVNSKTGGKTYFAIVDVHCPEGRPGTLIEVFPKNPKK
jgi:hypothetical protein